MIKTYYRSETREKAKVLSGLTKSDIIMICIMAPIGAGMMWGFVWLAYLAAIMLGVNP